jgi:hypothetical protein
MDLLYLPLVRLDGQDIGLVPVVDDDLLLCPSKHGGGLLDKFVHAERLDVVLAAPREPEELPRQVRRVPHQFLDCSSATRDGEWP